MNDARQLRALLDVTNDLLFSGQANGGGVVRSGARLYLSGQMNGRLTVEIDAYVYLSGQLNGNATVSGALDITGQLNGIPTVASSGRITFATGSSIVRYGQTLVVNTLGEFQPLQNDGVPYVISENTPRWLYQQDGTLKPSEKKPTNQAT
ncbi:hypothetical protein [Arthrobacter sp. ZBG10]|uniref:hypothetical protein n=1 Tax=Arthrobacter sp. ZBG10 TaxID=1676590 RepID=UPI0012F7B3E7|nr:hypothetical protein [Arthrobacter sp. ZBG10]